MMRQAKTISSICCAAAAAVGALSLPAANAATAPRPDYSINAIQMGVTAAGDWDRVFVIVANLCEAAAPAAPQVRLDVAGGIYVGRAVFQDGARTAEVAFALAPPVGSSSTIRATVNADKAVPEAFSGNNFLQKNPEIGPPKSDRNYCLPENYEK